ncbi:MULTISPECIES: hypothetical protein [Sphingomonas]|uniref:hypothetical protein n=1 Tax=Sphingomonas TaxID=13687 RepID=UPI0008371E96|nr:hypothetical protein [Sphingomonas sp. CCH10-B3]
MTEEKLAATDRIDRALTRIDTAIAARAEAHQALIRRHAALRARMGEAIEALDKLLADARG